jgi:hypothetical protein
MLPSLAFIDEHQAQERQQMEDIRTEADDDKEKDEKKSEMKQVMVKIKKKESEKEQAYRKLTHAYMRQMEAQEDWVDVRVHPKGVRK